MRLAGACLQHHTVPFRFHSTLGKSGNFEADARAQWLRWSALNQPHVVHQLPRAVLQSPPCRPIASPKLPWHLPTSLAGYRALTMASASPKRTCLRFGDGFIPVEASMRLGICGQCLFRCPPVSCPLVSLSERLLGIDCAEDAFMMALQSHGDHCVET